VIRTASVASLGATVLVDVNGMTLYSLSAERNGKFICTSSSCLQVWHPLSASAGAPSGSVGSLGTVTRPDGTKQATYKGMPLYTFASDQKPGEAGGQGIKDVGTWAAVTVTAKASTSAPASAPAKTTAPSSSGGGGGYAY
jgi:predicted lipoprotein with Yx(FWY)xxD motif